MSEFVPIQYEFDESSAQEAAQRLKDGGIAASVEGRRGSYAVVVQADLADDAVAKLGRPTGQIVEDASQWRTLGRKGLVGVTVLVGIVLLASSVWGIAVLWGTVVIGGFASAVFYSR